jgi:integrase
MQMPEICLHWLAYGIRLFVLIVSNPAFMASQLGHKNAEMTFTVYSAWINALDSDQVSFLNQR